MFLNRLPLSLVILITLGCDLPERIATSNTAVTLVEEASVVAWATAVESDQSGSATQQSFLSSTGIIYLRSRWTGLSDATVRMDVYRPDGTLHQDSEQSITDNVSLVETSLPVHASNVSARALYGSWQMALGIDSDPMLAFDLSFTIEQDDAAVLGTGASVYFSRARWADTMPDMATQLSTSGLRELWVHSVWEDVDSDHLELRTYYTPNGELYYRRVVAAVPPGEPAAGYDGPSSLPHTRTAEPAHQLEDGRVAVSDYFWVEGTWVTEHGILGWWSVEVRPYYGDGPSRTESFLLD